MAVKTPIYSDFQYEKLRLRLLAYQRKHSKKPQGIANDIVNRTGYAMPVDGGRKRVERFLTNSHRVGDDFLAAVEAFLGDFQLVDYAEAAAAIYKLSREPYPPPSREDISRFAGVYHATMTALMTVRHESSVPDGEPGIRRWVTSTIGEPAYPVFRMRPMDNNAGLVVWAANSIRKPEEGAQPEDIQNVPARGIASRIGNDALMAIISEPYGSFYYHVKIASEEPFTLYGYGQHVPRDKKGDAADMPLLPFEPTMEIRMVRIKNQEED